MCLDGFFTKSMKIRQIFEKSLESLNQFNPN